MYAFILRKFQTCNAYTNQRELFIEELCLQGIVVDYEENNSSKELSS